MSADHRAATEWAEKMVAWPNGYNRDNIGLAAAYLEARQALLFCYEKLQPLQPFEDWVKEIGK